VTVGETSVQREIERSGMAMGVRRFWRESEGKVAADISLKL
jgi:hypothetical protein